VIFEPDHDATRTVVRGVLGALRHGEREPTRLQLDTIAAFARIVFDCPVDVDHETALEPAELAAALSDPALRRLTVTLLVTMEFVTHGLPEELDASVREYAAALGIKEPLVRAAHALAERHVVEMYADIQRHSWYTHETARRALGGHVAELFRSKIAALGGPGDERIAARWRALEHCPAGTWGRAVFDFYGMHGFTFPGEHDSIRSVGAEHDWVHVLAGYETDPEGEIDVFAFIAASMGNEEGLAMFASTLGLFQNGTIHRIAGKKITIATADTLELPGAPARLADAFRRGGETNTDVLDLDHFAWKDVGLDEACRRLNVLPKEAP
jgi:hypothetical protein